MSTILIRLCVTLTSTKHLVKSAYDALPPSEAQCPWSSAVYFEGSNVLVKIDGADVDSNADPDLGGDGLLFSAHFDSVSTAPGATDDGMGVATLISLVDYFSKEENRPRKTIVFNINNGEEDGLYGAHA